MAGDAILNWIIIIGASVIGAGIIFALIIHLTSHTLIVRDKIRGKNQIKVYKVFERKDKDTGIMYWVSVFGANVLKTPKPPAESIEVNEKGKRFAECLKITEDQFIWLKDRSIKYKELKDDKGNIKKEYYQVKEDGTIKTVEGFEPFTVVQRETMVNQFKKAQEMKNKRWTADKVVSLSAIVSMMVIIIMLFVFWSDLAKPVVDMDNRLNAREQRLYEMEQKLCGELTGKTIQTVQPEKSNVVVEPRDKPPGI